MIRADILSNMKTRFAAITKAGGYNYTVSKAALFDVIPTAKSTTVFVSIIDNGITSIGANIGGVNPEDFELSVTVICRLRVPVTGVETDYTLAPAKMSEDIRKSIGTDDTWTGKAFLTVYESDTTDFSIGDVVVVQTSISLKIQFRVSKWSS